MNYHDITPKEFGTMDALFEDALGPARREYCQRLGDWLKAQVKEHCPEAYDRAKCQQYGAAKVALNDGDFYFRPVPDGVEFCRGQTVLARARFVVEFTVTRERSVLAASSAGSP